MKWQRAGFWICFMILMLVCTVPASAQSTKKVTPGLDVIAQNCGMVKSCLQNNDLVFCAEDFDRVLNVSSISSITITELPPRTDGILCLGMCELSVGQSISRANLDRLYFLFENEEIRSSGFRFVSNFGEYEIACSLLSLDHENKAPLATASVYSCFVSTYEDTNVYGRMTATDPENDELTFEVVSGPGHGQLTVADPHTGYYVYSPKDGFRGKDSFTYVAVDEYGHYSDPVPVSLLVDAQKDTSVTYRDTAGSAYEVAAMKLSEMGLVSGTLMDGQRYFYPDRDMDRMTFLVAAMKILDIKPEPITSTVFADNDEIPQEVRPYVEKARRMGAICARLDRDGQLYFDPTKPLSTSEAAVMLEALSGIGQTEAISVFADVEATPVWAKSAVSVMDSVGVFDCYMGQWQGSDVLTRGAGTYMLYRLQTAVQSR